MSSSTFFFCCIGFFILPFAARAQKGDTTKMANVRSSLSPKTIIVQDFDSIQKQFFVAQDATALLEANSNTYVRNYGLSNLSTLSIRGSSVAQTNVVWNGVPIQNTMLGLTDLSTVPNFFFDKMSVYPSGFNQKGSVQSIAGRLDLANKNTFTEKRIWRSVLLGGAESFGNVLFGAKVGVTSQKWNAQLKYYNRQGQNKYSFFNRYNNALDTISHSYAWQEQLLADVGYKLNDNNIFSFHFWRIKNKREIAPLAFGNNEERAENNTITRFGATHKFVKGKILVNSAAGLTIDSFRYDDGLINLQSLARVRNIPLSTSSTYFFNKKSDIGISYNGQFSFYEQKDRDAALSQNGVQVFYNNSNLWKGIQLNTFVQQQFASIGKNPLTYGARLGKNVGKNHFVYASYNTNYRLPTLNELYYFPGGNENLLPESAKSFEIGGRLSFKKKGFSVINNLALYSRFVEDWILWSGAAIFFPDNIAEVWSRGVENNLSIRYAKKNWSFRNDFLFAYNRATSEEAYFVNDQSVGKQIPYVPRTSWRNNFYASRNQFSFQLNYSYTGYRFLTRDESEFVDPYYLLNTFVGYKRVIKKLQFELQFRVNNITNQDYESMRGRIMPRRNFGVSLLTEMLY